MSSPGAGHYRLQLSHRAASVPLRTWRWWRLVTQVCRRGFNFEVDRYHKLEANRRTSITNAQSMEQSPLQGAGSQELLCLLWNLKVVYCVNRKPALVFFCRLNSVHNTITHLFDTHLITFLPKALRLLSSFPTRFWMQLSCLPCVLRIPSHSRHSGFA